MELDRQTHPSHEKAPAASGQAPAGETLTTGAAKRTTKVELPPPSVPMKTKGQADYEADVQNRPVYHDGTARKAWDQLGEVEKWSWERPHKVDQGPSQVVSVQRAVEATRMAHEVDSRMPAYGPRVEHFAQASAAHEAAFHASMAAFDETGDREHAKRASYHLTTANMGSQESRTAVGHAEWASYTAEATGLVAAGQGGYDHHRIAALACANALAAHHVAGMSFPESSQERSAHLAEAAVHRVGMNDHHRLEIVAVENLGTEIETGISKEVTEALQRDLRSMNQPGGMLHEDAFRYEAFSRRLMAAEDGSPKAVAWAMDWYSELLKDKGMAVVEQRAAREDETRRQALARAELAAGRAGNPHYQAFLDTVEDPANLQDNVGFICFMGQMNAEMERLKKILTAEDRKHFIRSYADQHLSERVKAQRQAEVEAIQPGAPDPEWIAAEQKALGMTFVRPDDPATFNFRDLPGSSYVALDKNPDGDARLYASFTHWDSVRAVEFLRKAGYLPPLVQPDAGSGGGAPL